MKILMNFIRKRVSGVSLFSIIFIGSLGIPLTGMGLTLISGWPKSMGGASISAPTTSDLDDDGKAEILFGLSYYSNPGASLKIIKADGSAFPGWPGGPSLDYAVSTPVVADIDADGQQEILATRRRIVNDNWESRVYASHPNGVNLSGWPSQVIPEGILLPPVVGDIAGDAKPEIIVMGFDTIFAWNSDGTYVDGWPKQYNNTSLSDTALAVDDIDNDGKSEVILVKNFPESVVVLDGSGSTVAGWPQTFTGTEEQTFAIGDLDQDGAKEIFLGTMEGQLYAWHADGSAVVGWPKTINEGENKQLTVSLADVTGDGKPEIFGMSFNGFIYAWDSTGASLSGWPIDTNEIPNSENWIAFPASFADVNGDHIPEIFVGTRYNTLHGLYANGTSLPGFPLESGDLTQTPILSNIKGGAMPEIIASTLYDNMLYAWEFPSIFQSLVIDPHAWTSPHHDVGRSSYYR